MARTSNDETLVEDGHVELETLLEKQEIDSRPQKVSNTRAVCSYILQRASPWTSILRSSSPSRTRNERKQPLRPTAYLDGLRGFAALLVYSLHHELWAHSGSVHENSILEKAFGRGEPPEYYFVCFPLTRIFFSGGHFAVAVFFVISGYVLSTAPLSLVHARETERLADNIGSALFRRWLRLFLPIIGVTFIWMTSWHIFGIESSNSVTARPEKTYGDELWRWYCDFKNFSYVFTSGDISNQYNDHTWSIPLEFRGSILVYTAHLAFARCTTNARILLEAGLAFYFMYIVDGWYCALFAMGMLLCDLDILAEKDQLPRIFSHSRPLQGWIYYVLFLMGLYLAGVPSLSNDIDSLTRSYGWYYLSLLKPQAVWDFRWFYRFWGATFIMISIPRISRIKAFFEGPFCQYLGKVSFSFYLVHGPVLWTLGDRLYAAVGRIREEHIATNPEWNNLFPLPSWGPFGLEINYLIPHLILLPSTLWIADVVTKTIDEPSNKASRWLFNYTTRPKRGG